MLKFKEEGKYKIIATKYEDEDLTVNIAFEKKFPPNELFIVNKIKHCEKSNRWFKEFYIYFLSKNKLKDFCDFFSINNYFYVVFRYKEEQNLKYKYNKKICITNFRERVRVFEHICVKIRSTMHTGAPLEFILTMIDPKNISISEKDEIFFNFDMRNINNYLKENKEYLENKDKYIVKKIHKIFTTTFEIELLSKYNKIMKLMSKKSELGIYKSLEEFVIDLKDNIEESEVSSFLHYLKYQFRTRKQFFLKLFNAMAIPAIIVTVGFIVYNNLSKSWNNYSDTNPVVIGEISYSANGNDKSPKSVDLENLSKSPLNSPSKTKSISIPKNAEITFDDYIVQNGDTPSSISQAQYGNKSFGSAITSFNDVRGYLIPGTILRVPSKSVIDQMAKNL